MFLALVQDVFVHSSICVFLYSVKILAAKHQAHGKPPDSLYGVHLSPWC